jgi:hypothetical protein
MHTITAERLRRVVPSLYLDGPIAIIRPVAICPYFRVKSLLAGHLLEDHSRFISQG